MPRDPHPLCGLAEKPFVGRQIRPGELRAAKMKSGDRQTQMLAEWMRAMHFPQRGRQSRGIHKGRFHVRTVVLEPLKTNF